MQIGLVILIAFIISMTLVLRIKEKVSRIFSAAAIACFFLAMTIVAVLPSGEVTSGRTTFVASLVVIGFIFVAIVLVNILFQNSGKKKSNKTDKDDDNAEAT